MKILGLEFSSPQRSAAVWCPAPHATNATPPAQASERGGGNHPFALVESALAKARVEREQITALAVGLGPGSYTGVRAAIAIARGWELAMPLRLIGIRSTDILAAEAASIGMRGDLRVLIDAQRREFYLGSYQIDSNATWAETAPLRIITKDEAQAIAASGANLISPDTTQFFPSAIQVFPSASTLTRLAAAQLESASMDSESTLEPVYLREPQFVKAPKPRVIPTF